jgi:dsDNA-specific endonuclease/ATPase MutS2
MLTGRKKKALEALLVCKTRQEAAAMAGIDRKTLWAYMRDEEFKTAYNERFTELLQEATQQARQYISPALETLDEIRRNAEASDTARISASRSLLEYALELGRQTDFAARLEELERDEE